MRRLRRPAPLLLGLIAVLALLAAAGGASARTGTAGSGSGLVEVVVTLPQPPLSQASLGYRLLAAHTGTRRRLNVRAPASVSYLRTLASAQRTLQARIETSIPDAQVRWRYGVVLDGMAVVVPRSQLATLSAIPGATVWPSVTYHSLGSRAKAVLPPQLIGATTIWGPTLATAGQGMKIGIIDDGLDQTHPYFDPTGFTYPAGFPKGNTAYTTPKVIVARAFAPASETWKYGDTPFDPQFSYHATHVAGIAAGDHGTIATAPTTHVTVSGVAPAAYLGNYKVLTVPTADYGLDGNSPEIVAGIEQAVKDGMDVINLSLGEPEIEPSRDIVVKALDDAANAGVVPVVAAGNDYQDAGRGSVGSPATAPEAISVAASDTSDEIASFSSGGPTPISLQMKPDVTAPGESILSSLPGGWDSLGRDEHGDAARRRRGGAAEGAPPDVDRRADQVGARVDRRPRPRSQDADGGGHHARGRRPHRHPPRRQSVDLHRPDRALVRPRAARRHRHAAARDDRRRRRCSSVDGQSSRRSRRHGE